MTTTDTILQDTKSALRNWGSYANGNQLLAALVATGKYTAEDLHSIFFESEVDASMGLGTKMDVTDRSFTEWMRVMWFRRVALCDTIEPAQKLCFIVVNLKA